MKLTDRISNRDEFDNCPQCRREFSILEKDSYTRLKICTNKNCELGVDRTKIKGVWKNQDESSNFV